MSNDVIGKSVSVANNKGAQQPKHPYSHIGLHKHNFERKIVNIF